VASLKLSGYRVDADAQRSLDELVRSAYWLAVDQQTYCDPSIGYPSCPSCLPLTRNLMAAVTSTDMAKPPEWADTWSPWFATKRAFVSSLIATTITFQQVGHRDSQSHGIPRQWGTLCYDSQNFPRVDPCRLDVSVRLPSFYPDISLPNMDVLDISEMMTHSIYHHSSCKNCDDLSLVYLAEAARIYYDHPNDNEKAMVWEDKGRTIMANCARAHIVE
jgi:hypothetical protein